MKISSKKTLRLALVGAGGIGKQWAEAIRRTRGIKLAAVVDVNLAGAKEIATTFSDCAATSDWHDVTRDASIDAVLVATPHKWLAPISYGALAAKKHVLCEKPCGINLHEVEKNMKIARKNKMVYMPGLNHRYHPAYLKAREIFDRGGIGRAMFIRARYGFGGRPGYNKEWRFKKDIAGGGELFDQGAHMIDMACWFLGDIKDVHGFAEHMFWKGEVEDNGFALLRTRSGQVAQIHVSWSNWDWVHSFEFYGDKGYLIIDGLDKRYHGPERLVWGVRDKTFAHPIEKKFAYPDETKYDSLQRELAAFVGAVQGGVARGKKLGIPTGEDAYAAMQIIEKIYRQKK
jgi:predicted dehydrogenase